MSPAISTVILIAITIALSLAVGAWLRDLTTGYMRLEEMSLDSATADVPTNTITAHVRNSGKDPIYLDKAYVDGELSTSFVAVTLSVEVLPVTIGDSLETGFILKDGTTYEVKIVSNEGTQLVFSVRTP